MRRGWGRSASGEAMTSFIRSVPRPREPWEARKVRRQGEDGFVGAWRLAGCSERVEEDLRRGLSSTGASASTVVKGELWSGGDWMWGVTCRSGTPSTEGWGIGTCI